MKICKEGKKKCVHRLLTHSSYFLTFQVDGVVEIINKKLNISGTEHDFHELKNNLNFDFVLKTAFSKVIFFLRNRYYIILYYTILYYLILYTIYIYIYIFVCLKRGD